MIRATMALRNTLRQPRRTLLLGGAIAFGVIVICLASGFTAGMEQAVQANVTLFSAGHILVNGFSASASGRGQARIEDPSLEAKAREILPEAISVSPTAQSQATIVFGSREQQLRVRGVDWSGDRLFSKSLILTQGDWISAVKDRSLLMGAQSARRFGLGLGDSVFVRLSTVTGQQNVMEYTLGAVYDDAAAGGMTTVLVPLANILADLNMRDGQYQSLAIFLPDASSADLSAARLSEGLKAAGFQLRVAPAGAQASAQAGGLAGSPAGSPAGSLAGSPAGSQAAPQSGAQTFQASPGGGGGQGRIGGGMGAFPPSGAMTPGSTFLRVATVTELSGQMGAVLGSVRWIGLTIFAIMLLLTMAGITNTYRMVLMERTREIGMLRCIGFRRADIFRIFVYEALMIAIAGSVAGILASLPLGFLIHLIPFDPAGDLGSALSRGRLLFSPEILSLAFASICVAAASVIAVFGPARRASRLLPAEALRKTA